MAINLSKGQKISLTKGNPGLSKIMVGLGWDVNKGGFFSEDFDLDASAFLLDASGKCPSTDEFIDFGNLTHPSGAVKHMGDNLTGGGEGDDEQIKVNLSKLPANIEKIAFTVTIFQAESRKQNFGQVSNAFCRAVDESTGTELVRYNLGKNFSSETSVIMGELYRRNGEWQFSATGSGLKCGLSGLRGYYGLEVKGIFSSFTRFLLGGGTVVAFQETLAQDRAAGKGFSSVRHVTPPQVKRCLPKPAATWEFLKPLKKFLPYLQGKGAGA